MMMMSQRSILPPPLRGQPGGLRRGGCCHDELCRRGGTRTTGRRLHMCAAFRGLPNSLLQRVVGPIDSVSFSIFHRLPHVPIWVSQWQCLNGSSATALRGSSLGCGSLRCGCGLSLLLSSLLAVVPRRPRLERARDSTRANFTCRSRGRDPSSHTVHGACRREHLRFKESKGRQINAPLQRETGQYHMHVIDLLPIYTQICLQNFFKGNGNSRPVGSKRRESEGVCWVVGQSAMPKKIGHHNVSHTSSHACAQQSSADVKQLTLARATGSQGARDHRALVFFFFSSCT